MAYGYNPSYNPSVNYFGNPYTPMMNTAGPMQAQQPMQLPQTGQMGAQTQPGTLYARYVAGPEEAAAAMVIADGSLNLFVDENRGMVYAKRLMPDGTVKKSDYELIRVPSTNVMQPAEPQQVQQWAPMEAVEQLRAEVRQLKDMFRERGEHE